MQPQAPWKTRRKLPYWACSFRLVHGSGANGSLAPGAEDGRVDLGLGPVAEGGPMSRGAGDIAFAAPYVAGLVGVGMLGEGFHAEGEIANLDSLARQAKRSAILMERLSHQPSSHSWAGMACILIRGFPAMRLTFLSLLILLPLAPVAPAQSAEKPFYLHANDTVVFYGDSITEQRYYTGWVEVYAATRFPLMPITFYSVGVGGDRVTGGGGGPIDLRLSRDLFPLKPTVVAIMLGMNDGNYAAVTPATESTYLNGYEHILDSIQQTLPGTRVTLLGPSPYDEVTRAPNFPGGYNATLTHFSDLDHQLAQKHGDTFIDLNPSFVDSLKRGVAIDPLATELFVPDRVHPEPMAHWFMAAAILKGWNAPSIVTSVNLDAEKQAVVSTVRTHVTDLSSTGTTVSWSQMDEALPLPLDDKNAANHFLLQISDIQRDLNQQPLTVQGLKPGKYHLTIDGTPVGDFSEMDLAHGVNLTDFPTPMRGQSYAVSWLIRDRDDAHYVRLRMLVNQMKYGDPSEPGAASLLAFEDELQKRIYEAAQPKLHKYQLKAIEPAP